MASGDMKNERAKIVECTRTVFFHCNEPILCVFSMSVEETLKIRFGHPPGVPDVYGFLNFSGLVQIRRKVLQIL